MTYITVEIISDSTRISICNWLLGYLPTGAPHQTPVGCVAEIFGAQNGTQNGGNQEKKKPSSHAVWPYEHQNSKCSATSFQKGRLHVESLEKAFSSRVVDGKNGALMAWKQQGGRIILILIQF